MKGPLIRTLGFDKASSLKVQAKQELRISSNQQLLGDDGMLVINYPDIHEKVEIGDKILIDQGGVLLTVIGFESEDQYLNKSKVPPSPSNLIQEL